MQIAGLADTAGQALAPGSPSKSRNLLAACLAHALHDGYTDGLYAFLPVWQAQFGLSYAGLAVVRALYYGTWAACRCQPTSCSRLSPRAALALSTLIAAAGFLIMALPFGFAGLCVGLVVAGIGSSIQHPRGSCWSPTLMGRRRADRSASTIFPAISGRRHFRALPHCSCRSLPGVRS